MATFEDRHKTEIRVGSQTYSGWQSVAISFGLETAARSFAISATAARDAGDRDALDDTPPIPDLFVGDAVEVFVGAGPERAKLITGYIDAVAPSYDAETSSIGVSGRSKTGDLVDCAAVGARRFNKLKIEQIAAKLASPYGVRVRYKVPPGDDTGGPIRRFTVDQGEEVFEAIERAARLRGLLITDNAAGELVLVKAAPGTFPINVHTILRLGRQILDGRANFDGSNIFSEYICRGQRAGSDDEHGALVAGVEAIVVEAGAGRRRVRVLSSESGLNAKTAQARAQWEQANALGRSTIVDYTVRGWFDESGAVWEPGQLFGIVDRRLRIEADLLLVDVSLVVDDTQGHVAKLTFAPESGYFAQLPDNPRKGLGAWRKPTGVTSGSGAGAVGVSEPQLPATEI